MKPLEFIVRSLHKGLLVLKLTSVVLFMLVVLPPEDAAVGGTIFIINSTSCTAYDGHTVSGNFPVFFNLYQYDFMSGVPVGNIPPGQVGAVSQPDNYNYEFDYSELGNVFPKEVVYMNIGQNLVFELLPCVCPVTAPDDPSDPGSPLCPGSFAPVGASGDTGDTSTVGEIGAPGAAPGPGWPSGDGSAANGDPPADSASSPACPSCKGMPVWNVSEPYISLWLHDEPLGYQPALGPRIALRLAYKQREYSAGQAGNFFSLGRKWNFPWFSYVTHDSGGNNVVHFGTGQQRTYYTTNDYLTNTRLTGNTTTGFTNAYPDGSQNIYGLLVTNTDGSFQFAFLSEIWNAQAQRTKLVYAPYTPTNVPVIRLNYVVDGDGKTNTINYAPANDFSANLIGSVVDPYGRTNTFAYDDLGHLTNMVDVAGITNSFVYDQNDWITNMTTPYGTTSFALTDSTSSNFTGRAVLVTEPDGGNELYLYKDNAPGVTNAFLSAQVPSSSPFTNTFDNSDLNFRNSFHWGRLQYAALTNHVISTFTNTDFRLARMKHWLTNDTTIVNATISLERDPSPDSGGTLEGQKTWYDYAGKTNTEYAGTQVLPLCSARVLPDGSTRFVRTERNSLGMVTRSVSSYASGSSYRTNVFNYSANGQDLLALTNALGIQVSSNSYNSYHQMTTNFNALGETTLLTYNGNQQLTSVSWPSGLITTNVYLMSGSSSNHLDRTIDYAVNGGTVYYRTNVYTWANDLVATLTDPRGLSATNTWDNLQRLTSVADSRGTNAYSYSNLDLVQFVDKMGYKTSFGYDSVRRLVTVTNANGTVTRLGYCTCGSLQAVTNAFGTPVQAVTSYYYDNQGNAVEIVAPDSYAVNYNYNLLGQLTNLYDAVSSVTNLYNNQGLLLVSSNAFGQVSAMSYDILDRPVNVTDANAVTTTNTYDNLYRVLTRGYPDGGVERFVYTLNTLGITSYTNQLNSNVVNFTCDPLGRKLSELYPGVTTNSFSYGPASDLLTLTDGKGQVTTWNYDQYGRNTNKVDATSTEILRFQYDVDDRLTNRWSRQKGNTAYSYDLVGNNTNISYPVSPGIKKQYDPLNRLTNLVDAIGGTSYGYTSAGQIQSEDGPWADDTVSYTYNNRLRSGLRLLAPNASPWAQSYAYDAAKRLTSLASPAGTFNYGYDPTRNLQVGNLALPNGALITNRYDSVARLLSTTLKNSSGGTLNSHSYLYNLASQRSWLTNTSGDYRNYAYDNIGQLTSVRANEPGGTARSQEQLNYIYDAAGNLMWRTNNTLAQGLTVNTLNELRGLTNSGTMTIAGTTTSPATNVTVWGTSLASGLATLFSSDNSWARTNVTLPNGSATYNASAQDNLGRADTNTVSVNLPNGVAYQYDANGNLTNDGLRSFVYDDENELISVVVTNGVGNSTRSDFAYDGLMRRRIRTEMSWGGSSWLTNQVVRCVYDGAIVIQERDGNNLPLISYTRGRDVSGTLQGAGGIGGLLARTDNSVFNALLPTAHAYYHADGNGNVTCLLNTNQAIVAKYLYDPFGNVLAKSGSLADANLYRFSSQEFHTNSSLICYDLRFYDPGIQRWLNRDPIGERGGINLYQFVGNNPISNIDPYGLENPITGPGGVAVGPASGLANPALFIPPALLRPVYYNPSGPPPHAEMLWNPDTGNWFTAAGINTDDDPWSLLFMLRTPSGRLSCGARAVSRFSKEFLNDNYPRFKYPGWWRDELWDRSIDPKTGRVFDVSGKPIDPGVDWQVGHHGMTLAERQQWAAEHGLSYDQWYDMEHYFSNFRPELPTSNAGHVYENWPQPTPH